MPNFASDILVNVVRTKIPLISISFSSLYLIFVLVLVLSTIIQNVFVIFVMYIYIYCCIYVHVREYETAQLYLSMYDKFWFDCLEWFHLAMIVALLTEATVSTAALGRHVT